MINIFGLVGEDVRASDVLQQIQNEGGDTIEVIIMSPGGSVSEGLAIYDALVASGKTIITKAMGQACSIASIIFMAGDVREVADNAELMIHNISCGVGGNAKTLRAVADRMDENEQKLVNIYLKSGLSGDMLQAMIDNETFMSADEAVEKGFATNKINAMALVAMFNKNESKEPLKMADIEQAENISDDKEKGLFTKFTAWLKNESCGGAFTAVSGMKKTEEVEVVEEVEVEEVAVDQEKEDLKAELEALKAENAERLAAEALELAENSAEEADVNEKSNIIFKAMQDNKILLADAVKLTEKPLNKVVEAVAELGANATKRGNEGEPDTGLNNSIYEQYQALKGADRTDFFNKNKDAIIEQSKES
tara:strand:+ start:7309 stop:8403 length:1095 start_codon:yes stop_codon:yes gene_type:complete